MSNGGVTDSMSEWTALPYQGLGDLRFGMSPNEVHALIGLPSGHRSQGKYGSTDYYDEQGVHVHYDLQDVVVFIEVSPPCVPKYDKIKLIQRLPKRVLQQLAKRGHMVEEADEGYNFPSLGIRLYVPYDKVEAAAVYREGYYEMYK